MDQQEESRGEQRSPHSLSEAKRTGERRHAGRFYLVASALVVGMLAGVAWLSQSYFADLGKLYDEASAPVVGTMTAVPAANTPLSDPAVQVLHADKKAPAEEPQHSVPAAQMALAIAAQATVRPTRTATPVPYLDSTEAVVGRGGGEVWNADGTWAGMLAQGAYTTASKRSTDGKWVFTRSDDSLEGWMDLDNLIIFDTDRLAPVDIEIVPVAPTPVPQPMASQSADDEATPLSLVAIPTVTPPTGKGFPPTDSDRQPTARIALDDSRLNVRAGPGDSYRVIAKALPEEMVALRARSDDGKWIQIDLPDVAGGFGWAYAEYLQTSADLNALPVATAVSSAPSYIPVDENSEVMPAASPVPLSPAGVAGIPPVHVGPPVLGSNSAGTSTDSVTGLSGKLVIQKEWGGDIYVYDLSTGDLRLLTGGFDPAISPDGSLVTFTRDGGENGVYVIDIDGGAERLLFGGREHLRSPKFSPDGQYIVFERGDEYILCKDDEERCRVSVPSPDGDLPERERQPSLARIRTDGSDYWDPMDLPYARVPDWNEGGIVYQSNGGLQIAQNEPNVDTKLVYFEILKQYEMDPDWQPGAGRIAFQQREINHWEIYAVNPDGSGLQALTQPPFALSESFPSNVAPAWSPDGKHIVFLSNRNAENAAGKWGVWVMDADGTSPRRLPIELPFVYTYVSEQMLDWGL